MDLDALRREYVFDGLNEEDLRDDPFRQFDAWFGDAVRAKIELADVMTLATASKTGVPSARMVVLRGVDEKGFVFYTDYGSAKSEDLADNPRAALVFYWRELGRQVRISGTASRVSTEESAAYFNSRPLESRLAALASFQSEVVPDRRALEERYESLEAEYASGGVPYPARWGGFRVSPDEFEFWQGRDRRLHDRIRYRRDAAGSWRIERLSP